MYIDRNSAKRLSQNYVPDVWNPKFGPDDIIYGGNGIDVIYAGDGKDIVYGGGEGDYLYGEGDNDKLYGEAGSDYLYGGAGDDHLYGGAGGDKLDGGSGADVMAGGAGSDRYYVDDIDDVVVEENAGEGNDEVVSYSDSYVLPNNVERLYLLGQALDGDGNGLDNEIYGNAEDNVINGHCGQDRLRGYDGSDVISGGDGNDTIWGGAGHDELTGGTGADLFLFKSNTDADDPVTARDVITDFNPLEGDRIDLAFDADETMADWQEFEFIGGQPFYAPGQIRVVLDPFAPQQTYYIELNTDSDWASEASFELRLAPGVLLPAHESWFL